MKIKDMMRLGSVTRFHMVRAFRQQTVAEHSYRVWLLAEEMMRRLGIPAHCNAWLNASRLALIHDSPESVLGDTATPYKDRMRSILEVRVPGSGSPTSAVERGINPELDGLESSMKEDHPEMVLLVKVADLLESAIFLKQEGIGVHERGVADQLFHNTLGQAKVYDEFVIAAFEDLEPGLRGPRPEVQLSTIASQIYLECVR